jgi:glycosyltransferase involved in cell wall biosynthesis
MRPEQRTVCLYAGASHLGGAERCLLELAQSLSAHPEHGYVPWVLLPASDGPLKRELTRSQIACEVIEMPSGFAEASALAPMRSLARAATALPGLALYLARVGAAMARAGVSLVHAHGMKPYLLSPLIGCAIDVPVLWQLHSLHPPLARTVLRAVNRLFPVTKVAVSRAAARHFAPHCPPAVAYNGIDPRHYRASRHRRFHAALGLAADDPVVGIVGVLCPGKGQLQFLRMAHRLLQQRRAGFVVVGDEVYDTVGQGGYGARLREEACRLGIDHAVRFVGFMDDAVDAYAGLDVLVHATFDHEAFGRVVVEGMSCGVPVVATALDGVREIVTDGVDGLLVPPGDVAAMAAAVERLLGDSALRSRLRDRALRLVAERFTLDRHREAMIGHYDYVIARW